MSKWVVKWRDTKGSKAVNCHTINEVLMITKTNMNPVAMNIIQACKPRTSTKVGIYTIHCVTNFNDIKGTRVR